ncbi:MAG: hypothetical protein AAGH65_00540 [Pseudomonadota bacterium]
MATHYAVKTLAIGLLLTTLVGLSPPSHAGDLPPWVVNIQEIAPYTPLEIKFAYYEPDDTLAAAVLYNDGLQNRIDLYNFSVSPTGVTVEDTFSDVATGDVFALGEICTHGGLFVAPYIDDFDIRALRWNDVQSWDVAVDTTATNHTNTDCLKLDANTFGITSLDFDVGEIDIYRSLDVGLSWSIDFSYSASDDDIIGPFNGGFRPKSGAAPLITMGTGIGITYQVESGPIESVLIDPVDESIAAGPSNWDLFSDHDMFIGNGSLKEMAGIAEINLGMAIGAANGGEAIAYGTLGPTLGDQSFRLLNPVITTQLSFQGLALEPTWTVDDSATYIHIISNQHVRVRYDFDNGAPLFELIEDYPFLDIGGPVDVASGEDRLFIGAPGLQVNFRGGDPTFQIATLNPDPAVMVGVPLPGGTVQNQVAVTAMDRTGMIILLALIIMLAGLTIRRSI